MKIAGQETPLMVVALVVACLPPLLLLLASPASADVTVERHVRTSGVGGFGGGETSLTVSFSGLRKREVSTTRVAGALGGFMNQYGGGDVSTDTLTDAVSGLVVRLDHRRKTYTEAPLSPPPAAGGAPAGGRIVRSQLDFKETGETKTISGFECARTLVTWTVETEDAENGERTTGTLTMDVWSTAETRQTKALREQESTFAAAYRRKLGIDQADADIQRFGLGAMAGLLGGADRIKGGMREFSSRMQALKGFPIAYAVTWKSQGGTPGAKASTVFDSYTEIRRIDQGAIPAGEWEIPSGYTRVK